ncbi:MAG: hypothetical protein OXI57_09225 [Rhodospirillales bacterium]|nr:hypothetical protein [Rhodospirillales bacterium]
MLELIVLMSALQQLVYCPRQCVLIRCDGVRPDIAHTVQGWRAHRRVDIGRHGVERGRQVLRGIPLWSELPGLSGRADDGDVDDDPTCPVDYKSGVRYGVAADVQVCAQ